MARESRDPVAPNAPISLRDGLIAAAALVPRDREAQDALLECLGLPRARSLPESLERDERTPAPDPGGTPAATEGATLPWTTETQASAPDEGAEVSARLDFRGSLPVSLPSFAPGPATPLLASAREGEARSDPPSLFPALEKRGIYGAALATWAEGADVDIERTIDGLANAEMFTSIPRLLVRTLRRGVQLLLDEGPSMEPFRSDVRALERDLMLIVSPSLIDRQVFHRCPTRKLRTNSRAARTSWRPPPRGTPVFVVSDFGVSGSALDEERAAPEEWERFASAVRAEGHQLLGLTPFAAARWPPALAELFMFVHWAERTTVGDVDRWARALKPRRR